MTRLPLLQLVLSVLYVLFSSCRAPPKTAQNLQPATTAAGTTAQFITADYIDLDRIEKISKFRSGAGHDFSDSHESCRSMKHYFWPKGGDPGQSHDPSWTTIRIYSPVAGKITRIMEEWAGKQIWIEPDGHPATAVRIFHVSTVPEIREGSSVTAGQRIGNHASDETMSDFAVEVHESGNKRRLVSYFDVITNNVLSRYKERGITGRAQLQFTKFQRMTDRLTCDGEKFTNHGMRPDWVTLTD